MAAPKLKKKKTLKSIFRSKSSDVYNADEALDASLMRLDRQKSSKNIQFDTSQTEMLDKIYEYHNVDTKHLKNKFKKAHQFDTFMRNNKTAIDNARTANIAILGTSGSGKTKLWWNFLNYYNKSYLDNNSWGISPKDFYILITEKIMNISIDMLIEYNYDIQNESDDIKEDIPSTCLARNNLMESKEYKLEIDTNNDVKEGYDFFQDLISKLDKIRVAIKNNVEIEEKKKLDGIKPNWDKIQELRNIEKKLKEYSPSIAPMINKLWKSKQLAEMYLYKYGLNNSRNLLYFIDKINKFVLPKKNNKWEWEWAFDEILRCQIKTTGVIQQMSTLYYYNDEIKNDYIQDKHFHLKLCFWDVGGAQNERKKWKHVLNLKSECVNMNAVVYMVNLMGYYKQSGESNKNSLVEDLELFSCLLSSDNEVHNSDMHECVHNQVKNAMKNICLFYVIFTDSDGLKEMLDNNVSFKMCFDDYKGDDSVYDVQSFVENKFQCVFDEVNGDNEEKGLKCRFVSVIDHDEMKSVMNEIVENSILNKIALNKVIYSLFD